MVLMLSSNPENFVELVYVCVEFRPWERIHHASILHEVESIGDLAGEAEVLLDEQNGHPALLKGDENIPDALHDHGRKALRRLVEEEDFRAGAQHARNGEHLLLATR
jgi:hypothetical protein